MDQLADEPRASQAGSPVSGAAQRAGRAGRRPGESGTREAILTRAREAFAARGFERTTIRAVAAAAGVDPSLVCHYYGTKAGLFSAALELPAAPQRILQRALSGPADQVGASVVRGFLDLWDPPEARQRLVALLRSAMTNDAAMAMVREMLAREVFGPVTKLLGVRDAPLRATLVGSQFIGLALMRYVARIEPVASASIDELAAAVGPTVQRYLTGEIGGAA